MKLSEFFLENRGAFLKNENTIMPILMGENLAKLKRHILCLDEFKGVRELNVVSEPYIKTHKSGKPKSYYLCFSDTERRVIGEKFFTKNKGGVDFRIIQEQPNVNDVGIGNRIVNLNVRMQTTIKDEELVPMTTANMFEGMFSETVDIYNISLSPGIVDRSFMNLETIPEGVWVLPMTYNLANFTPNKMIVIKVNPELARDRRDVNNYDYEEAIKKEIINKVNDIFKNFRGDNVPKTHHFMVRVSSRSLRHNTVQSMNPKPVTITLNNESI